MQTYIWSRCGGCADSITPGSEQLDITNERSGWVLVPIASGRGYNATGLLRQNGTVLGHLRPNETVTMPDAKFVHLDVAKGGATLEGAGALETGDSVRTAGAEVLLWEMRGRMGSDETKVTAMIFDVSVASERICPWCYIGERRIECAP